MNHPHWSPLPAGRLNRRYLFGGLAALPLAMRLRIAEGQTPEPLDELVIDLPGPPESIDPALAYSPGDWSIVHSVYDALIQFDGEGKLVPLAAQTFDSSDAINFQVALRPGLTFHDGSPVTSSAIANGIEFVRSSGSQAVDLFATIQRVDIVDELHATIVCAAPSPWLPAQLAVWPVLVPDGYTPQRAAEAPIGSGPYVFESYEAGSQIVLRRNETYTWGSPKGTPLANRITYRFVPEATTRLADLASGTAHITAAVPPDQVEAVEDAGATVLAEPSVGIAVIRIPSDVAPFDDVRVRQAINYAIDRESIIDALLPEGTTPIATVFPDNRAIGFDADLDPYPYDPDKASELLTQAGFGGGFATQLEITAASSTEVAESIVAHLAEVGIDVELVTSDLATFNAGWIDGSRPPLRMVTWTPLFEPHTFLSLVFVTGGYLSRYSNGDVDAAFAGAAAEADENRRADHLRDVGKLLHDDAAAVFLWNLVTSYGVAEQASAWTPRGDDYIVAAGAPA